MKTRLLITMAAAAIVLAGCSKEENEPIVDNWNGEIRLSSGVTVQTRAHGIDQQIADGQNVSFYVDDTEETKVYGKNNLLANGSGGFTGGTPMYYPSSGKDVDIYAIHPATAAGAEGDDIPTTAYEFAVNGNQTAKADYAASDLLYSIAKDVKRSSNAVQLTFYHMLSKVEVALKTGAGSPDLTGAIVTIENTKLKTNFLPSKSATLSTVAGRQALLSEITTGNDAAPITIPTVVSTDNFGTATTYGEAIVIPNQTIAKDAAFIKVLLKSGGTLSYKIPDADGLKLESGKRYQYQITVNLTGLTVTSDITNWEPVNPVTGTAEME